MPPTPSALREIASRHRAAAPLSTRELTRRDEIQATAADAIGRYGVAVLTFSSLANACRMAPATLRRFFADLDAVFEAVFLAHWAQISHAISAAPRDPASRRAAYLAATRGVFGGPTPLHRAWLRDRHYLPEDLRNSLDLTRDAFAPLLMGGTLGMDLLDCECLTPAQIERLIAAEAAHEAGHAAPDPGLPPDPAERAEPAIVQAPTVEAEPAATRAAKIPATILLPARAELPERPAQDYAPIARARPLLADAPDDLTRLSGRWPLDIPHAPGPD